MQADDCVHSLPSDEMNLTTDPKFPSISALEKDGQYNLLPLVLVFLEPPLRMKMVACKRISQSLIQLIGYVGTMIDPNTTTPGLVTSQVHGKLSLEAFCLDERVSAGLSKSARPS